MPGAGFISFVDRPWYGALGVAHGSDFEPNDEMAATSRFAHSSRSPLTPRDLGRFPSGSLFDSVARALCSAECLPRKELYEAWEVARRVRRRLRGGRVLDLASGHGLLAHLLLLLDASSEQALAIDARFPESAGKVSAALSKRWPRLAGRVEFVAATLEDVPARSSDRIVSCHACGALTDRVLDLALTARAAVAVLPCCHDARENAQGGLGGWLDPALAIDVTRAARLRHAGYAVHTQRIPSQITPKNRLLIAEPLS